MTVGLLLCVVVTLLLPVACAGMLRGTHIRIPGTPALRKVRDPLVTAFLSTLGPPSRVHAARSELQHPSSRASGWMEGVPAGVTSQWRDRRATVFGAETSVRAWWAHGAQMELSSFEDVEGGEEETVVTFMPRGPAVSAQGSDERDALFLFSVCSWNTWNWNDDYERRVGRMRALLEGCDLVLLQEMRYRWAASRRTQRWMIRDFVRNDTWAWDWKRAMVYLGEGGFHNDEGLAFTLSTRSGLSALESEATLLSRNASDEEDEHQRALLRIKLVTPAGQEFHAFVTHMSLSARARARNAVEILRVMKRYPGVQLLAGDLNGTPDDVMYKFFTGQHEIDGATGDLVDLWPASQGVGNTFPAWAPSKRIDFLMMRGGSQGDDEAGNALLTLNSLRLFGAASTREQAASDHLGLRAEMQFAT